MALVPSAIAIIGLLVGLLYSRRSAGFALLTLVIAMSVIGYLAFVIVYPDLGKGDTIKATYILQVAPFIAILSGKVLHLVGTRSTRAYNAILAVLLIIFAHNVPALITNYVTPIFASD